MYNNSDEINRLVKCPKCGNTISISLMDILRTKNIKCHNCTKFSTIDEIYLINENCHKINDLLK